MEKSLREKGFGERLPHFGMTERSNARCREQRDKEREGHVEDDRDDN
jgi:hypothetical protein